MLKLISAMLFAIASLLPFSFSILPSMAKQTMSQATAQISYNDLVKAKIHPNKASKYVYWLNIYAPRFGVTTRARKAHFLAQIAHESGGFTWVKELSSGAQYEWRVDLGNIYAGDGAKYKGRGLLQYSGRWNYADLTRRTGINFTNKPWLLEQPQYAVLSAFVFWDRHNLNKLADQNDLIGITRRINGGLNGLKDRRIWYYRFNKTIR